MAATKILARAVYFIIKNTQWKGVTTSEINHHLRELEWILRS